MFQIVAELLLYGRKEVLVSRRVDVGKVGSGNVNAFRIRAHAPGGTLIDGEVAVERLDARCAQLLR